MTSRKVRGVPKLLIRLLVLSSVPLAVAFSYDPERQLSQTQAAPASWASYSETPAAASTNVTRAPITTPGRPALSETKLREALENRGLPLEKAELAAAAAACTSKLSSQAHLWHHGQRLTGIMLVPDAAQAVCGYGDVPQWVFRSRMLRVSENVTCAAKLHQGTLSEAWFRALSQAVTSSDIRDSKLCATALALNTSERGSSL